MIIRSVGFVDTNLIRSRNALNFAYVVYLNLRKKGVNQAEIEKFVRRWFVLSILTGRYSGSPESNFDVGIRNINEKGIETYIEELEAAELSDAYWTARLPQQLTTPLSSSPAFKVYLAAQFKLGSKGFLATGVTIKAMVELRGDIHHIFPKSFLKKKGSRIEKYNQVANYVYTQTEINIAISDAEPRKYMETLKKQCAGGPLKYGGITDKTELLANLKENDIPDSIVDVGFDGYEEFIAERRKLMAKKIKDYYHGL